MDDTKRRERLERLFLEHAGAVRAYARRRADPAVADDVLSEVFVVAWRRLDDVPENALPWLLGCARNVLAHHWRRSRRDRALLDRIGGAGVAGGVGGGDRVLAGALARLDPRDREVLLLIAWEGLTPGEAARVLGCSRNALAVRLHRARKRLAVALSAVRSDDRPGALPQTEEVV